MTTERERLEQGAARVKELAAAAQLQVHVEVLADATEYFDGEIRVDFEWSLGSTEGSPDAWQAYRVVHYPGTRMQPPEEDFNPVGGEGRLDDAVAIVLTNVVSDRLSDFREREQEQELLDEQEDSSR